MTPETLVRPETQQLILRIDSFETEIVIANNIDYERTAEELKQIKSIYNILETERKSATKPMDEAKKKIMDWFRTPLDRLVNAETKRKKAILTYQQEQERKRKEEENRLAELKQKEAEKLQKKAEKAEAKGDTEKAEELRQQAQDTAAITPTVGSTIQKVEGTTTKKLWKFEIIDEKLIPRSYLIPDTAKIGKEVRACGDSLSIPGIRIYAEETLAVKA